MSCWVVAKICLTRNRNSEIIMKMFDLGIFNEFLNLFDSDDNMIVQLVLGATKALFLDGEIKKLVLRKFEELDCVSRIKELKNHEMENTCC